MTQHAQHLGGKKDLTLVMVPPWQTKMPPLGLAYLSSFIVENGFTVEVIDINVGLYNSCAHERKYFWDISTISTLTSSQIVSRFIEEFDNELNSFIESISRSETRFIGFSTTSNSIGIAIYLANQIKIGNPSKVTILGGPGCFSSAKTIDHSKLVDIYVVGEGELPLLEIMKWSKRSDDKRELIGTPGVVVLSDNIYQGFSVANPCRNLDEIPYPKYREFNLSQYDIEEIRKIPMLISRGCINRCAFCVDCKLNNPFRFRSPELVVDEMLHHIDRYGVKRFALNDLLCNGNLKQLERICDLIIEKEIKVEWSSYAAIRDGMSPKLFSKMKRSGCTYICYGMESASSKVLQNMGKRYDSELSQEVLRNSSESGILTAINIIIGYPGESEREFKKTCEFLKRNRDYIDLVANVSSCFLIGDTDIVNDMQSYGIYFKHSFHERVTSFLRKEKIEDDITRFYSKPGNTPRLRARRLRKILLLLKKLYIPYSVINYEKNIDRNFEDFKNKKLKKIDIVQSGDFILDLTQRGIFKLYGSGHVLTRDIGINTSFNINNEWFDSSSASWKVIKYGRITEIDIRWPKQIISQRWIFDFSKKYAVFKVRTYFLKDASVMQQKVGIILSKYYSRYKVGSTTFSFPKHSGDTWREVHFSNEKIVELVSDNGLPNLALEVKSKKESFLQLQNTPPDLCARMVNVCAMENSQKPNYNLSPKLFKKGSTYIESMWIRLRQDKL